MKDDLDHDIIAKAKIDGITVAQTIADALTEIEGIELAVTRSDLSRQGNHPLILQVRNNHHVSRSGDIYIIQQPYWFLFDKGPITSMHGSPWRYDTHVPIIFMGKGLKPKSIHRRVHPVDVAPTIAALLGMSPPGAAQGFALVEVLR